MNQIKALTEGVVNIPGLNITSMIVPCTTDDNYATHDSKYGKGGWHEVKTIEERNNIPKERRTDGMACYVKETGKVYILNGLMWTNFVGMDTVDVKDILDQALAQGTVEVNVDLTNYVTNSNLEDILGNYVSNEAFEEHETRIENVENRCNGFATNEAVQSLGSSLQEIQIEFFDLKTSTIQRADLENYVTTDAFDELKNTQETNDSIIDDAIRAINENYVQKTELDEKGYATLEEAQTLVTQAVEEINSVIVTKTELEEVLVNEHYLTVKDLRGYATEAFVLDYLGNYNYITVKDLRGYATEAFVLDIVNALKDVTVTNITTEVELAGYVKRADYDALLERLEALEARISALEP